METKIGFKVLTRLKHGTLASYATPTNSGGIKYRVGRFVQPKSHCGPLCVFETLEDAQDFVGYEINKTEPIYQVCYVPSKAVHVHTRGGRVRELVGMPYGTRLARKVKLLTKVQ